MSEEQFDRYVHNKNYMARRKDQGFNRVGVFIHDDDKTRVIKYANRIYRERLKKVESGEAV